MIPLITRILIESCHKVVADDHIADFEIISLSHYKASFFQKWLGCGSIHGNVKVKFFLKFFWCLYIVYFDMAKL